MLLYLLFGSILLCIILLTFLLIYLGIESKRREEQFTQLEQEIEIARDEQMKLENLAQDLTVLKLSLEDYDLKGGVEGLKTDVSGLNSQYVTVMRAIHTIQLKLTTLDSKTKY